MSATKAIIFTNGINNNSVNNIIIKYIPNCVVKTWGFLAKLINPEKDNNSGSLVVIQLYVLYWTNKAINKYSAENSTDKNPLACVDHELNIPPTNSGNVTNKNSWMKFPFIKLLASRLIELIDISVTAFY